MLPPLPLLALGAFAAEPEPIDVAQGGVPLVERRYARLDGDDREPASPRWRRRSSGDFVVWERPDGTVQRAHTLERGHLVRDRVYDLHAYPSVTVTWADDVPTEAVVHLATPVPIPLDGWTPQTLPDATVHAPAAADGDGRIALGDAGLRVWTAPPEPVWSDAFRDAVAEGCGCTVVERTAVWVDGQPGVRIRLRAAALGRAPEHDLWAVPRGDHLWLAAFTAPPDADPDRALAPGRALLALVTWRPPDAG